MALLFYISVFVSILVLRYRIATGKRLSVKSDEKGRSYYEGTNIIEAVKNPDSKNRRRSVIDLGLDMGCSAYFRIRRKTLMLRFLQHFGLAQELSDTVSKDLVFIADHPDDLHDLTLNSEVMHAVEKIFSFPETERLICFGSKIWVKLRGIGLEESREKLHESILRNLWEIKRAVEENAARRSENRRFSGARRLPWIMAAHLAMLGCGVLLVLQFITYDTSHPVEPGSLRGASVLLTMIWSVLWLVLLHVLLKRTMWTILALADFFAIGFTGILFLSFLGLYNANIYLPQAAPLPHGAVIAEKRCTINCYATAHHLSGEECGPEDRRRIIVELRKKSRCINQIEHEYSITVVLREYDLPPVRIKIGQEEFDRAEEGGIWEIPVYPGALGRPWFDRADMR